MLNEIYMDTCVYFVATRASRWSNAIHLEWPFDKNQMFAAVEEAI